MSIKLVAVDIDGTLLTNDRKVTPEVFEAVQDAKKQGVKVNHCYWTSNSRRSNTSR